MRRCLQAIAVTWLISTGLRWATQRLVPRRIRIARRRLKIQWPHSGITQEDSTHVADDVVTVGLTYSIARIEASGFHGREPDEFRWDIDQGKINSWSTRLTVQPSKNWSGQYSYGRIASPEALFLLKIKSV